MLENTGNSRPGKIRCSLPPRLQNITDVEYTECRLIIGWVHALHPCRTVVRLTGSKPGRTGLDFTGSSVGSVEGVGELSYLVFEGRRLASVFLLRDATARIHDENVEPPARNNTGEHRALHSDLALNCSSTEQEDTKEGQAKLHVATGNVRLAQLTGLPKGIATVLTHKTTRIFARQLKNIS